MTELREKRPIVKRRRLLLFIFAVLVIGVTALLYGIYQVAIHPQPEIPVGLKEIEGFEYILTCRATWNGPIELKLWKCVDSEQVYCPVVAEGAHFGLPCDDMVLQLEDDTLFVSDGISTILEFDVSASP